jgi:hypothetical protein
MISINFASSRAFSIICLFKGFHNSFASSRAFIISSRIYVLFRGTEFIYSIYMYDMHLAFIKFLFRIVIIIFFAPFTFSFNGFILPLTVEKPVNINFK